MHTGTVKWYNHEKRFGFIKADSGGDVFIHEKTLKAAQLETLIAGQKVMFTADMEIPKPYANAIMVTATPERRKSAADFEEEWGLRQT